MKGFVGLILVLLSTVSIFPQETVSEGVLLRTNFYNKTIDTTDVVATWKSVDNSIYSSNESFEKVFTFDDTTFFLKKISSHNYTGFIPSSFTTVLINSKTEKEKIIFGGQFPECGTGIYLSPATNILRTKSGVILFNNLSASGYYLAADKFLSMCNTDSGQHVVDVVGKINDKYLVVESDEKYPGIRYFIEDLDNYFVPELSHEVKFQNIHSDFMPDPLKAYRLTDSLSLMDFGWINELIIAKYSDSVIVKVDSLSVGHSPFWTYKNDKLFFTEGDYLSQKEFDKNSNTFKETKNLFRIGGYLAMDADENYIATIYSDTVYIYSLPEERTVNKIDVGSLKNYSALLIDPPYLYIQKLDKVTGVNKFATMPITFQLFQNYPNPFNPSTKIKYSISAVEALNTTSLHVTLKIYDVLGREVAALVNEEKPSGNYEVEFNGEVLASGIYFCFLKVGYSPDGSAQSFVQTKKMLLMK